MTSAVDRLADLCDTAGNPRRGFVVHDAHRLDSVLLVGGKLLLDQCRIDAVPPIARYEFDFEPEPRRHLTPQGREVPSLEHQNPVAGRQGV